MPPDLTVALTAGLRAWTRNHHPHVRAAAELLINHDFWLRHKAFTSRCMHYNGRQAWIDWAEARSFASQPGTATTGQRAMLDLAVALGENRYHLNGRGPAESRWIADAVAQAVGVSA